VTTENPEEPILNDKSNATDVFPAEAEIQLFADQATILNGWIPAFARTTGG